MSLNAQLVIDHYVSPFSNSNAVLANLKDMHTMLVKSYEFKKTILQLPEAVLKKEMYSRVGTNVRWS